MTIFQVASLAVGLDPTPSAVANSFNPAAARIPPEVMDNFNIVLQAVSLAAVDEPVLLDAIVRYGNPPDFQGGKMSLHGSTVSFSAVVRWFDEREIRPEFFFPVHKIAPMDFMDPDHNRFAPELALAVTVWQAMATAGPLKKSPRAALETWIREHPEAWLGPNPLGQKAKERRLTMTNWKPDGGMQKTCGD